MGTPVDGDRARAELGRFLTFALFFQCQKLLTVRIDRDKVIRKRRCFPLTDDKKLELIL
jgi:hypothetical protein